MRNLTRTTIFLLATSAGAQSGTPAQETTKPTPSTATSKPVAQPAAPQGQWLLQRSDRWIGLAILNAERQAIGRVEDLMLRPDGTIGYAVVSMLDDLHRLHPIPWSSLEIRHSNTAGSAATFETSRPESASLPFSRDELKGAPSFERGAWSRSGEGTVFTDSDAFFRSKRGDAAEARPVEASAARPIAWIRVSDLRHRTLAGTRVGEDPLGTLDSVFFDTQNGRIGYVTVSLPKGRLIAMPWEALQATRQGEELVLGSQFTADQLDRAPRFLTGNVEWIRMSDPNWVREMYRYYSVPPYWIDGGAAGGSAPPRSPVPRN